MLHRSDLYGLKTLGRNTIINTSKHRDQSMFSPLLVPQVGNFYIFASAHYLSHVCGALASLNWANMQNITTLHNYRSRPFNRILSGEHSSSALRDMGSDPWAAPTYQMGKWLCRCTTAGLYKYAILSPNADIRDTMKALVKGDALRMDIFFAFIAHIHTHVRDVLSKYYQYSCMRSCSLI